MTETELHTFVDAEPSELGMITVGLWHDTTNDVGNYAQIPEMDDAQIVIFFENIERYFYRQGGYLRRCGYCGKLYPHFPFGIGYGVCNDPECVKKDGEKAAQCMARIAEKREEEAAAAREKRERKEKEREDRKQAMAARRKGVGYVYLMRGENGLHKIGRAMNVEDRRAGLERSIPVKVEIVHKIACGDYINAEKILHARYAERRIRYEWFDLLPDQVAEITGIRDYGLD